MAVLARSVLRKAGLLAGASGAAIALALSISTKPAEACSWAPEGDGIAVTCEDGDTASSFSTSYDFEDGFYDGSGADRITMDGGLIVGNDGPGTPTDSEGGALDFTGNSIFTNAGNDVLEMNAGQIGEEDGRVDIHFGDGDDELRMEGGTIYGDLYGEGGTDTFTMTGGLVEGSLFGQGGGNIFDIRGDAVVSRMIFSGSESDIVSIGGNARIEATGAAPDAIGLEDGNDEFNLSGDAYIGAAVSGGAGNDTFNISGGTIETFLNGGSGNDVFNIGGSALILGFVLGDDSPGDLGDDIFIIGGDARIVGHLDASGGNDQITISDNARIEGAVYLGDGNNSFAMEGGFAGDGVVGGAGNDNVTIGNGTINGWVELGAGANQFTMSGGAINGGVVGEAGIDVADLENGTATGAGLTGSNTFTIGGGQIAEHVAGWAASNSFTMTGGQIGGDVLGGAGDGVVSVANEEIVGWTGTGDGTSQFSIGGGQIAGSVIGWGGTVNIEMSGGAVGEDVVAWGDSATFDITGGMIGGDLVGRAGTNQFALSGNAAIAGDVLGGEGADTVQVSGDAAVGGSINLGGGADVVEVRGGRIGGGIEAGTVRLYGGTIGGDISGLTPDTLEIDDSVVPEALILQDGVTFSGTEAVGTIRNTDLAAGGSQNFVGFDTVEMFNSTLRFADGTTQGIDQLTLDGGSTLFAGDNVTLDGSLTMTGGSTLAAGAGFNIVDGLVINGATIVLDVDQNAGTANALNVGGTLTALGDNTLLVNLAAPPAQLQTVQIPLITADAVAGDGTFSLAGIPGGASLLFDYQALVDPTSGVSLLARPNANAVGLVTGLDAAAASQVVENMTSTLYGILWDVSEHALGLSPGAAVAVTPTFGVFASGQFARVNHGGFTVSNGGASFAGPSFDSNDFSAAVSLDFNAAKHFGLDPEYGLNLGVFGGYTSTDLTMNSFLGFNPSGRARNQSGMVGGYALLRRERNYLLVSGTGLFGRTNVRNQLLGGATGRYGTAGGAFTASAGRIFLVTDRVRFDMRGGLVAVGFRGRPYVDSIGLSHGASRISFGAVKLEPGIYADYVLEDGMVFSPYLRGELQQRFAYRNVGSAGGLEFDFDDADLSAAVSAGFNLRMSPRSTFSAEVRGKASADSTTFAGKIGLKIAF